MPKSTPKITLSLPNKLTIAEDDRISKTLIATAHVMLALNILPIYIGVYPMFGIAAAIVLIAVEYYRGNIFAADALALLQKRLVLVVLGLVLCTMYVTGLTEESARLQAWTLLAFTFTPLSLYDAYTTMQGRLGLSITQDILALIKRAITR